MGSSNPHLQPTNHDSTLLLAINSIYASQQPSNHHLNPQPVNSDGSSLQAATNLGLDLQPSTNLSTTILNFGARPLPEVLPLLGRKRDKSFSEPPSCASTPSKEHPVYRRSQSSSHVLSALWSRKRTTNQKPCSILLRLSNNSVSRPGPRSRLLSTSCPMINNISMKRQEPQGDSATRFLSKQKSTSLLLYRCFAGVGNHARQEWKATLTVGIVLLTFLVC